MIVPHLPHPLDAADVRMLARLLVYSLLVIWVAVVLGLALRIFLMIAVGAT